MMKKGMLAIVAVVLVSQIVLATSYNEVISLSEQQGTGGSRYNYMTLIDGTDAYNFLNLRDDNSADPYDSARLTKLSDVYGTRTYSELVSTIEWATASGGNTNWTPFYGAKIVGDDIQFSDSSSDAIWRVNKNTGAITEYVSAATIEAAVGSSPSLYSYYDVFNGEHYFYEGATDAIWKTNAGAVESVITNAELIALTGFDDVDCILVDDIGDIWFAANTQDAMYKWDISDGTGSMVLSTAQLESVTDDVDGSVGFGDIYLAPDGKVYFYESDSDYILSFDPADPAGTIAEVISEADLVAGPAGSDSVSTMTWYDGNLAWTGITVGGLYALPEPMTLTLLGMGGLALLRRRR